MKFTLTTTYLANISNSSDVSFEYTHTFNNAVDLQMVMSPDNLTMKPTITFNSGI